VTDDASFQSEPDHVPAKPKSSGDGSGLSWGVVVFLICALLFVVFVVQNMSDVPIKLFGWTTTLPLPLVIVVTALLAVVADEIVGVVRRRRRRARQAEKDELNRYRGQ
jgi:uncharacterized integral membrane protein